jgi:antitoxin VapB
MLRQRPKQLARSGTSDFSGTGATRRFESLEFEFPGGDAVMRKEGEKLIIEPTRPRSLLTLLATLKPLEEDFPPIPDHTPDPVDL